MAETPGWLQDEARFLALLENEHRFPGEFEFKVICQGASVAEAVPARVAEATGLRILGAPKHRVSSAGKYISVSVMFRVESAPDVVRVYHAMRVIEGVVGFF
ncbi:MAG: DUF493 domain-containing protein [Bradymonadia bacterium]